MDRARRIGSFAASLALIACGPLPQKPKCVEVPTPAVEDFAACGGLTYHAGPGPLTPFSIRFKSELGDALVLRDVCILVDDYSLLAKGKTEWSGSLFRGKHVVKLKAVFEQKSSGNVVTIRSASEIASLEQGTLEIVTYDPGKGPAVRFIKPKGSECE